MAPSDPAIADSTVRVHARLVRVGMILDDLGDDLLAQVVSSCREREPTLEAVLVHGSYATGRAEVGSDLDLDLFVTEPSVHYRTWFEPKGTGDALHVSARCDLTIDVWEEEADEPEDWSLGLPVRLRHRWLWRGNNHSIVAALGEEPVLVKPGADPEIEDMVDAALKMRRHARSGDEIGVRLEAQAAARCASATVAALNDPPPVETPREAVEGATSLSLAPRGWPEDLLTTLGLRVAPTDAVVESLDRLVLGVIRLVREVDPSVDKQPDVETYVRDGTLERLLT
jgi:phosphoribosyl-AMP cyclohydrolase